MIRFIERRKRKPLIQPNEAQYLNAEQLNTYIHMQALDWQMHFIRRPLLRKPTVVMKNSMGTRIAVIERDGSFRINPKLTTRRTLSEILFLNNAEYAESDSGHSRANV
jgi:ABC-type dipeptide/oligopeptide/nickel transport system ATPase component